jgi:tetratricopeptide (TPR) repeat protein
MGTGDNMPKDEVTASAEKITIPTYAPKKAAGLPMFFENKPYQGASGRLYPLPFSDGISDEKSNVDYDIFTLENEYVRTQVLPRFGGKILRGYDKVGAYDFIYYNEVVKPALVGLAGPWISGGIEFNFPQHHRPTTYMPLEAVLEKNADGSKTVWTGEVEPFGRMKGMAGITVEPGRSYIKAKIRVYNRTDRPQVFMWWANLAVPVNDSYRTLFPPDVEWVNDHDRRAVMSWPVARGVYQTARPFDYGDGVDLSKYSSIKVPSSFLVAQGQSDMDFVGGYDDGRRKGIVTVANHHVAPGKKMWHWGTGDFGDMWCQNLTDENGPYIELMTGVYTDNQPDFTWLAPYESRVFEQYWYPIRDIGDVKNATIDAAVNVERRGDRLFFGFNVTGSFAGARISVLHKGNVVFEDAADLSPKAAWLKEIPMDGMNIGDVSVSLSSRDGKKLVEYTTYKRGQKQPVEPRKPVLRPSEIAGAEELYINGLHLEQYKQHNYDPKDYYLEGLKRDPGDARCNTALARLCLKNGEFEKCADYCDAAIKRLTLRNQHPADAEALYLKGLALKHLGKYNEAYDILFRAGWNYAHRSAAYYELANIDCMNGRFSDALEKLDVSAGLNDGHTKALNLKAAIFRKLDCPEKARKAADSAGAIDPLDMFSRVERVILGDDKTELVETFGGKPENFIDTACDYIAAGFYDDALFALGLAGGDYPLFDYYRALCHEKMGQADRAAECCKKADSQDMGYCFPSRLEDIAALECGIARFPEGANAYYYLGCLYYDKSRHDEAVSCWEKAVERNGGHAKAHRNLALAYFDKKGDFLSAKSHMEKALECDATEPRLLFEYQQLLKNMDVAPEKRLSVYDRHENLMAMRDDSYLDYLTLKCLAGDYPSAIGLAKKRRFHIYEGGEGKLTRQHAWMHVLYGIELAGKGDLGKAMEAYKDGINMPKSYGEAKTYFNQEAHVYYFMGLLLEKQELDPKDAFSEAAVHKAAVSEISMFRALALRRLGRFAEAGAVLDEMMRAGGDFIENRDRRAYYGVGSPSPLPFENDIVKNNLVEGYVLKAYASLGLGKRGDAEDYINKAARLAPHDFRIYAFHRIKDRIDV